MKRTPSHLFDRAVLLAGTDAALRSLCELQVFRGSGPGGQKRNKTSSGVRLVHRPTGLSSSATVDRSQKRNLAAALANLRLQIALHVRCSPEASPTPLRLVSPKAAGYAEQIGVAFDVLDACGWSVSDAAARCGMPTAQLSNWLADSPAALGEVNRHRAALGLRLLRPRD